MAASGLALRGQGPHTADRGVDSHAASICDISQGTEETRSVFGEKGESG